MKLYLASSFENYQQVQFWMARLIKSGHTITLDWTPLAGSGDGSALRAAESQRDLGEQEELARADLTAIDEASIVWVLAPESGGTGCWVEMGYALAKGKTVVVSGALGRTIFNSLTFFYAHHETAFGAILVMALMGTDRALVELTSKTGHV